MFVYMNVSGPKALCVCLFVRDWIVNINPYVHNLYGGSLHFSYLYMGSKAWMWGNVLARQPAASGRVEYTHNNPQSDTGTQDWINLHKK